MFKKLILKLWIKSNHPENPQHHTVPQVASKFETPEAGRKTTNCEPGFKIRIRITQKRSDPTGSGSGSGSFLDMFLMFSKINIFVWHILTKSKHLVTLKIKDKKIILTTLYFRQFYITRKFELQGSFVDKGSGSG